MDIIRVACEFFDDLSIGFGNSDRHRVDGWLGQVIFKYRSPGRVIGTIPQFCPATPATNISNGGSHFKQMCLGRCDFRRNGAQRRDIVKDPESPSMGCHHQIIVLYLHMHHDYRWQIILQRLPYVSIVERNVGAGFRSCIQQPGPHRVLANDPGVVIVTNPIGDLLPAVTIIHCLVEIRCAVTDPVAFTGNINRPWMVMRDIDSCNRGPFREILGGNIGPVLSAVFCKLHGAVIRAHPEFTLFYR